MTNYCTDNKRNVQTAAKLQQFTSNLSLVKTLLNQNRSYFNKKMI
jgi:hypothetical protein